VRTPVQETQFLNTQHLMLAAKATEQYRDRAKANICALSKPTALAKASLQVCCPLCSTRHTTILLQAGVSIRLTLRTTASAHELSSRCIATSATHWLCSSRLGPLSDLKLCVSRTLRPLILHKGFLRKATQPIAAGRYRSSAATDAAPPALPSNPFGPLPSRRSR
jgi:hypothetical protein